MADITLYRFLESRNYDHLLDQIQYKFIKRNYFQTLTKQSNQIFEIVEGIISIEYYSKKDQGISYKILTHGDLFGNYNGVNEPEYEFFKALTHVKVRVYDVNLLKEVLLQDVKVASFFENMKGEKLSKIESNRFIKHSYKVEESAFSHQLL